MTIGEFRGLSNVSQWETLWTSGKFVLSHMIDQGEDYDLGLNLYKLGDFYTEVFFELRTFTVIGMRSYQHFSDKQSQITTRPVAA